MLRNKLDENKFMQYINLLRAVEKITQVTCPTMPPSPHFFLLLTLFF